MAEKDNIEKKPQKEKKKMKIGRRDMLKGLATVPVLGAFLYGMLKKRQYHNYLRGAIEEDINMSYEVPYFPVTEKKSDGKKIRLGIVGYGSRGEHLLRAAGFAHPDLIASWQQSARENRHDKRYEDYMNQEDLNVEVYGVCDVFDIRAERARMASANPNRLGDPDKLGKKAPRYLTYKELIESNDIDAIIIATPDHLHATIAIDAANAGKHVYVEKGMTKTVEESFRMRDAIKKNNVICQVGHQGRQTESYIKAKEAIDNKVLGSISLIEVSTNRNSPNGAWVYDIHPDANEKNIDWKQFLGPAPYHPFSLERFFRWRCWWDYGTGLSGDLFTHEFDAINQVMGMGIPHSVVASGGIYFYQDGRTVPDVYHTVCEYPDRNFTMLYTATLASNYHRGKVIMGHDANMEIGNTINIFANRESTKYKEKIEAGIIQPELPIFSYTPGMKEIDAVTSATEQYFAGRGLLYTYRGGRRVDTTHLHIKEWIEGIREHKQPSCNIDQGFEEAISAHMGTISYKEGRRVFWDKENERVVPGEKV